MGDYKTKAFEPTFLACIDLRYLVSYMEIVRKSDQGIISNCHYLLNNYCVPPKLDKVESLHFHFTDEGCEV